MKRIEIQELIDFIAKSGLEEVDIETEAIKIHIKRSSLSLAQLPAPISPKVAAILPSDFPEQEASAHYITIKSPMVGTFYRAPSPGAAPFVQVGDTIVKGSKLCLIEAMKLYNELESEYAGKVVKILLDDVSPVEFDQALFVVDPT